MNVPYDLTSYVRVLKMATTPSREEFFQVSKIAGAGIFLIGFLGFIIGVTMGLLTGGL
ncbi:protein translocase SEC61 complex gamma subunit, archaeal and eukaryotic [Halovivax ruber XH-70]|uniref:Protein translocase subunit SecE n=2 Tax=Halovivax TaxID=332951 RepID=L0IBE4_HALRX|nr:MULTISPECIES: protein translocase SEC61 complex subunit gamma [Halovivax]AGB16875.1 protein translocase SEC61 complex gamma subunit, archaeal and eukaryotic [Halovivax ruber XH-70]ELZ08249.1 preprotein translocase subunit SecE [Halovivax asiaticus JCM 14624]